MTCILSLDLGTTGNRCLAVDQNGTVVAQAYQEFQQYFPQPAGLNMILLKFGHQHYRFSAR